MTHVAPSLLAADKSKLLDEILLVESLGATYLHWDVMDGVFVPNISYQTSDVKAYAHRHHMVNDVHIMVANPMEQAIAFIEAGANNITFHYEACKNDEEVRSIIDKIHSLGVKAGLSIKPKTDVEVCYKFLDKLDLILVMSVEPGLGGQKYIDSATGKIKALREYIDEHHLKTLIEVDGGINAETGKIAKNAGVDILVAGSYLFGHEDIKERIESLK